MPRFSIIFILLLISITSSSQSILSGKITLKNSNIALSEINVIIENAKHFGVSNGSGDYSIERIESGYKAIVVSGIGFKTITDTILFADKENIVLDFYLEEDIIDLPTVVINANSSTGGMLGSFKIPGSGHYISKADLKEINTTNPNDIFSRIPGVQIQEEDGFGLRPNIGLRASGSERSSKITIMEDGILSAPAPYTAPSAYYFPTIARMQGVEVRKGSSQIAYGPYTTGGIINLMSTTIPSTSKGKIKMGVGSFSGRNIHAHYGSKHSNISYLIETFQYSADGFKSIDFSDNKTGFDKKDYIGKVRWTSSASSSVYQSVELKIGESREFSAETYLGLSYKDFLVNPFRRYAGSQQDEMNTKHSQVSLKYIVNPANNLYLQVSGYNNTFARNWYKLDKVINASGEKVGIAKLLDNDTEYSEEYELISGRTSRQEESLQVKANNRSYSSRGVQGKMNYTLDNHSFELGIRYHNDEMDRFQWVDGYIMNEGVMELAVVGQHGTESNRIESATALASHFQYSYDWKRWNVHAGIRNEAIKISREDYGKEDTERTGINLSSRENEINAWIPGIGLQYNINDNHQVFSGVHKGFVPPGSTPETKPESSINYELGYRVETAALYGSVVSFFNDYSNLLGSDLASSGGGGTSDLYNGGEASAYGLETSFSYRYTISENLWMPLQVQYTFSNATFQNSFNSNFEPWGDIDKGDELPYISKHVYSVSTGLKSQRASFLLSANYTSDMRSSAGSGETLEENIIKGKVLLSANAIYKINRSTDISIGVHNLLNKIYAVASRPAGWRPGAPRNINLALEARF